MNKLFVKALVALNSFKRDMSGASLVEYSLLIGLITVATVVMLIAVGGWVSGQWTALNNVLPAAP